MLNWHLRVYMLGAPNVMHCTKTCEIAAITCQSLVATEGASPRAPVNVKQAGIQTPGSLVFVV